MSTRNLYKKEFIERRYRGEDVLSWIEQFGIHFLEDDKNGYKGQPNAGDHFLVLRICSAKGKKEDIIYAHHCFFKTDKEGVTTFCVNGICHFSTENLKELFEKAKWKENNTKNWWIEVFRNGFQDIDDVLCRSETIVSDSYKELSMQDFLKQIKEVIADAIKSLSLETTKITKVCIVEQYAKALPLKHVLYKMFPNSYMYTYVFTREMPMNNYGWQLKADKFLITEKLMNTKLNTSPQMTIGDILQLGEKGVVVTMPLTETELNLPIIDDCDLRWGEVLPDDIQHDFQVDDLRFKQLQLSVRADGLQNLYIIGIGKSAVVTSEDGKIKILYKKSSKGKHQLVKPISPEPLPKETLVSKTTSQKPVAYNSSLTENKAFEDSALELTQISLSNQQLKENGEKIVFYCQQALKRTTESIETIVRDFLLKTFSEELPKDATEEDKDIFWKTKYEDCLNQDWQKQMLYTWRKYKTIEFSNFYSFLRKYRLKLENYLGKQKYMTMATYVDSLRNVRNLNAHAKNTIILCIGRRKLLFCMEKMSEIARLIRNDELKDDINRYSDIIENVWDDEFIHYLNNK